MTATGSPSSIATRSWPTRIENSVTRLENVLVPKENVIGKEVMTQDRAHDAQHRAGSRSWQLRARPRATKVAREWSGERVHGMAG
jgi:hypothetical protein